MKKKLDQKLVYTENKNERRYRKFDYFSRAFLAQRFDISGMYVYIFEADDVRYYEIE